MVGERAATVESGTTDRLFFFSDAVVAIAITLLALELPVPAGHTAHQFWRSVHRHQDVYFAFLISFAVIAVTWSRHHHVFRFAERCDHWLRTLNMAWLLMIVLNPFATRVLTSGGHDSLSTHALRFGFYALLQVLASVSFVAMVHHLFSAHLQSADAPRSLLTEVNWQCAGIVVGFGLSIPLFFLTRDAWVLWVIGPVGVGQLARYRLRQAG